MVCEGSKTRTEREDWRAGTRGFLAVFFLIWLACVPAYAQDGAAPPQEWALYGLGGFQFLLTLALGGRHIQSNSSLSRIEQQFSDLEQRLQTTRETYLTRADWSRYEETTASRQQAQAAELTAQRDRIAAQDARLHVLEERVRHLVEQVDRIHADVTEIRNQNGQILSLLKGDGHAPRR